MWNRIILILQRVSQQLTATYPDNAGDARIVVYNMSGIIVHQYPIASKGNSSVSLDLQNLPSGIYFYRMMIDGNAVADKKRLVLIK